MYGQHKIHKHNMCLYGQLKILHELYACLTINLMRQKQKKYMRKHCGLMEIKIQNKNIPFALQPLKLRRQKTRYKEQHLPY